MPGDEDDHWDTAPELVAIEDGQKSTLKRIDQYLGPLGEPDRAPRSGAKSWRVPYLTDQVIRSVVGTATTIALPT